MRNALATQASPGSIRPERKRQARTRGAPNRSNPMNWQTAMM